MKEEGTMEGAIILILFFIGFIILIILYPVDVEMSMEGISVFYISSPTEVGVDVIGKYEDINIGEILGVDIAIPAPGSVESIIIKWTIYDVKTGEEINSDSFVVGDITKYEPFIFSHKTKLKKSISEIDEVRVIIEASGKINGIVPIHKNEEFILSMKELAKGAKLEW